MKVSLEKKYQNREIDNEELLKYKKQIIIKKLVLEAIYIVMIIISFLRISKNAVFYTVLGEGNFFSFYGVALVLFFVTMYAMFLFNTSVLLYALYKKIKKEEWVDLLHLVNTKLDIVTFICKCLSMLLFLLIYITTPCTVSQESMKDTFQPGDKILCIDIFYTPSNGDVIVFDAKNYTNESSFYIKRAVAVEGTNIVYSESDGIVYIDGKECQGITKGQFYNLKVQAEELDSEAKRLDNEFVIPKSKLLCLGDNRLNSKDSRDFGLVDKKDVLGKVFFRMYPLNTISFF